MNWLYARPASSQVTSGDEPGPPPAAAASDTRPTGGSTGVFRTEPGDNAADATQRAFASIEAQWRQETRPEL